MYTQRVNGFIELFEQSSFFPTVFANDPIQTANNQQIKKNCIRQKFVCHIEKLHDGKNT